VVGRQPVRDSGAAVMGEHVEAVETERSHEREHVPRHRALGVVGVVGRGGRLARIAVAAQFGSHQRETSCQRRRHAMPDGRGLRVAVQQ
jgi:hypothetical protein